MRLEPARIHAPALDGRAWLNTDHALSLEEVRGHVVVLDFWTYGCINCLHVMPMLARLEERFAAEPMVVIGVHAAKFPGERDPDRVRRAVARLGIRHPVVVDAEMRLWSRYAVRSWPTLVVLRPDGTIAATCAGEPGEDALVGCIDEQLALGRAAGTLAAQPLRAGRPASAPDRLLAFPGKLITDEHGNLWIADSGHHRIVGADRHGRVHTIIGSGRPDAEDADDGDLARARLHTPQGLALTQDGRILYAADPGTHTIRRIDLAAGTMTTVAGTGELGGVPVPGTGGPGLPALASAMRSPWDLALDEQAACLYIAMAGSHQIWRLDLPVHGPGSDPRAGTVQVIAGTGAEALVDGPALEAAFAQPSGLALSPDRRRLYVADSESSAVRVLHLDEGRVETLAGAGLFTSGDVDGPGDQARLQHCAGLSLGPAGLIVADSYNHTLRGINLRHKTVVTLWRGLGSEALDEPGGVAFDRVDRSYVVADTNNHRLLRVARDASGASELALLAPAS